jgi:hypothetical protein
MLLAVAVCCPSLTGVPEIRGTEPSDPAIPQVTIPLVVQPSVLDSPFCTREGLALNALLPVPSVPGALPRTQLPPLSIYPALHEEQFPEAPWPLGHCTAQLPPLKTYPLLQEVQLPAAPWPLGHCKKQLPPLST